MSRKTGDEEGVGPSAREHADSILHGRSLLSIIRSAQSSIPAFRYVVGFAAAAALLIILLRAWDNPATIVLGAVVMVLGGVLIRIFGRSVEIRGKRLNFAAEVLMYYVLATVVFMVTMLVSSVFFDTPVQLRSRIFGEVSTNRSEKNLNLSTQSADEKIDSENNSKVAENSKAIDIDHVDASPSESETDQIETSGFKLVKSLDEASDFLELSRSNSLAVAELDADLNCQAYSSGKGLGSLQPGAPLFYIAPEGVYTFECKRSNERKTITQELKENKRKIVAFNFDSRFEIVRDGTAILDSQTNKIWQRRDAGRGMSFDEGKAYCTEKNVDGTSHWGLPSVEELESLFLKSGLVSKRCNFSPDADPEMQLCYVDKKFELSSYAYWTGEWHARRPAPAVIDFTDRLSFGDLDLNTVPLSGVHMLTKDGADDASFGVLCIDSRT